MNTPSFLLTFGAFSSRVLPKVVAFAALSGMAFAQTNVGSTANSQATVTFSGTGTLNSISVVTQGVSGLDFKFVAGGSCATGTPYTQGQSCTVNYSFTPTAPGLRLGAVVLFGASTTTPIGTAYVSGTGSGPQAAVYPGTQSTISSVASVSGAAVDAAGNVFVLSSPGLSTSNGANTCTAGTGSLTELLKAGGTTTLATDLSCPSGLTIDGAGNVYVADYGNQRIAVEKLAAGAYTESTAVTGLTGPWDVAVDATGNLYVAENDANDVVKETLQAGGTYVQTRIDNEGGDGKLQGPHGIAIDSSGDLIVAAHNNGALLLYPGGAATSAPTVLVGANTTLNSPFGIKADGGGSIYIADAGNNRVAKLAAQGGGYATTPTTLAVTGSITPYGAAVDASGNVYISNYSGGQLLKLDVADTYALPAFAATAAGATSSDSPKTVTLVNIGNAALTFATPGSGFNPSISANFTIGNTSTCPQLISSSPTTTLGAGTSCTDLISFTPTTSGAITGSLVTTDNSLYATGTTQTVSLSGTGTGTQTITFPQPTTPVAINATYVLNATASSGLAVSYALTGPASLNGTTVTYTGAGTVTITASQAGNTFYTAAPNVARTVTVQGSPAITWNPSSNLIFAGAPIGAGILDATDQVAGRFTYTATLLPSGSPVTVTTATVLAVGSYTLTATFTPTDTTDYSTTTASISVTVQSQSIFVANSIGTMTTLQDNGTVSSNGVSGGGAGVAVDGLGYVWSLNTNQTSVSKFTDAGAFSASYSGAGLNTATALAIDGVGTVWIANGNGTVSALTNAGAAVSSTAVAAAGNISTPASLSIDAAGSIWIANAGNNTVTEVIGVAAPVVAPTVTAVTNATLGTKP